MTEEIAEQPAAVQSAVKKLEADGHRVIAIDEVAGSRLRIIRWEGGATLVDTASEVLPDAALVTTAQTGSE